MPLRGVARGGNEHRDHERDDRGRLASTKESANAAALGHWSACSGGVTLG